MKNLSLLALLAYLFSHPFLLQASEEIVIYTSRNEHLIRDIFNLYTQETGVRVTYRTGDAGQLIQALISEGERTRADIFMTVDAGNLWFAASQGILRPINSPLLSEVIPNHLRDDQGQWFGLSLRARAIVYNPQKVSADQLSTYEDLADEKWRGKLCLRSSRSVYNQSFVAMLIDQWGREQALEIVRGLVANNVEIFSNDTAVLRAVAAGQCEVGIVNSYYFGRLKNDQPNLPLNIFWPNQGESYGTHINISGAGVTKHAPNPEAAQKFLEWLAGPKGQAQFAQVNLEYAIHPEAAQSPEVLSWGDFRANQDFHLSRAGELQRQAIEVMHQAGYL